MSKQTVFGALMALALVFGGCQTDTASGSNPAGNVGKKQLVLKGTVFTDSGGVYTNVGSAYNSATVTSNLPNVTGKITNGELSYTLPIALPANTTGGVTLTVATMTNAFTDENGNPLYTVTLSAADANTTNLSLKVGSETLSCTSSKASDNGKTVTMKALSYAYLSKAVTVTGTKIAANDKGQDNFTLKLVEGWNVIYIKHEQKIPANASALKTTDFTVKLEQADVDWVVY
ncbi:MAG: hypothetical protein LBG57_04015 [Treponema sp.]|jgi:hypothetical protein|nr:hypothetical protein [Treponema sp.]